MTAHPSLLGRTVQIVRGPLVCLGAIDLVVISEQPYTYRPAERVAIPSTAYELHWPDGTTTWHLRHEFDTTDGEP